MNEQLVGQTVYDHAGNELGRIKEVEGSQAKIDVPMAPDYWVPIAALEHSSRGLVHSVSARGQLEDIGTSEDAAQPQSSNDRSSLSEGDESIELREERLRAGKTTEQAGSVTLGKRVVERTESVDVPVREERLVIERRAVNQRTDEGLVGDSVETIEVPLTRERAVVDKETVVTNEVTLRKEAVERVESVGADLRREELTIDEHGDVDVDDGTEEAPPSQSRRAS